MWKVRNQKFHRKHVRNSERTALSSCFFYILGVRYILTEMSEIQLFKGLIMKNDKGELGETSQASTSAVPEGISGDSENLTGGECKV
ncbi:Charged Multivesicular Body Protein 5 [Manis pentadactyla]|nr:Charged Multivesicular Body Protein 5 [Manis pentadactyla]